MCSRWGGGAVKIATMGKKKGKEEDSIFVGTERKGGKKARVKCGPGNVG